MNQIGPPDSHYLLGALGWLELGNHAEARLELGKVAPALWTHPEVLKVRWRIVAKTKDVGSALQIAQTLLDRRSARDFVRSRLDEEPAEPARTSVLSEIGLPFFFAIPYNLACCACQLGHLQEAWEWFEIALEIGELDPIRKLALNDPDLEPLWHRIVELG